jgi:hypothetical protein
VDKFVSRACRAYIEKSIRALCVLFPLKAWLGPVQYTNSLNSEFDAFGKSLRFAVVHLGGTVEQAQIDMRYDSDENFFVHNDRAFDALITHEFGHAVNNWIIDNLKLMDDADELLTDWQATKRRLEKELGYPSEYARKNNGEWFAERFTLEYLSRGVDRHLLRAINEFMDKWRN